MTNDRPLGNGFYCKYIFSMGWDIFNLIKVVYDSDYPNWNEHKFILRIFTYLHRYKYIFCKYLCNFRFFLIFSLIFFDVKDYLRYINGTYVLICHHHSLSISNFILLFIVEKAQNKLEKAQGYIGNLGKEKFANLSENNLKL